MVLFTNKYLLVIFPSINLQIFSSRFQNTEKYPRKVKCSSSSKIFFKHQRILLIDFVDKFKIIKETNLSK